MKQIGGGLIPPKQEDKKFSFGAVFGYGDPKELPATFRFTPLEIKDQHESDLCLAFTYVLYIGAFSCIFLIDVLNTYLFDYVLNT